MRWMIVLLLILGCQPIDPIPPPVNPTITDFDVEVDFSKTVGTVNMHYGSNEDDDWVSFVSDDVIHENHRTVGSEYIRIWLVDEHYKENTIPFDDWDFDYWALDGQLDAVFASGAKPFIVLANAPEEIRQYDWEYSPPDVWDFAYYAKEVAKHCREYCLENGCDTSEWYFEVWNEPWRDEWWEDGLYIKLFEETSKAIKEEIPAKVGGYSLAYYPGKTDNVHDLIDSVDIDFISLHHYGNAKSELASDSKRLEDTKLLLHDSIKDLRSRYDGEIINSEYSSDYRESYMDRLDEPYTSMWYATAMIWEIKSQEVSLEMFYSGTTLHADKGYGMWSTEGGMKLWPVYYMKSSFVKANRFGSLIYHNTLSDDIDILAVGSKDKYLTVVNKLDKKKTAIIKGDMKKAVELNTKITFMADGVLRIPLEPYEVRFFKVSN